ncbi:MAG TPA: hypothetical protein PLB06_02240 [Sulfurovum sp.]|jgi:hypothetical protein|nr:MAG: hypothetical protein B7Y63_09520 [Sulfurovum sp. 35-42-20]OYZ23827.1 MAG: hypothetical protein B7Y23_09750 [Sulfurovum sp. 16-42-52]OYZ47603.1 MAG: hypothetical protein B7Y13_09745 [Sulfurovum sp. 24-42-9]OZA43216.1 MAG: hypothetical protein B7X80_09505 [Sulfurovum sp. 17-42-90]HQS72082.1 hypothetical protein [Sulfurovum sp.]
MRVKIKACTPTKYISKIAAYITFGILMILFVSVFFFVKQSNEDRLISLGDQVINDFRSGLDYEMVDLLSLSLALSEDGELKNALTAGDEDQGYRILSKITERFKKYTHVKTLRIQILTRDFFIFARSWDKGYEGMPIWWFRDDLASLDKNSRPKVGMERGRLLTLKATIPMYSGDKVLGYLEVIKFIDDFALKLRKKGIELFALMDEEYMDKAELMQNFPYLNGYVVSNQNYNERYLEKIRMLDWKSFLVNNYRYEEGILYLYEPMLNGEGKQIGIYLLGIPEDALQRYEKSNKGMSFFTQFSDEDIKNVVDTWKSPHDSFRNRNDKEIIEVLPKLNKEDKQELEIQAKRILYDYSKDELIDIIVENKHNDKKIGIVK